jgi:hypothetical protein
MAAPFPGESIGYCDGAHLRQPGPGKKAEDFDDINQIL